MAGVLYDDACYVDYSIADGPRHGVIRHLAMRREVPIVFEAGGAVVIPPDTMEVLYDEHDGVDVPGWEARLIAFIKASGLNRLSRNPTGLRAFVTRLADDGKLAIE